MINELSAFPIVLAARGEQKRKKAQDASSDFIKGIKIGMAIAYEQTSHELNFLLERNKIWFPDLAHEALCDGWTELARAQNEDGN